MGCGVYRRFGGTRCLLSSLLLESEIWSPEDGNIPPKFLQGRLPGNTALNKGTLFALMRRLNVIFESFSFFELFPLPVSPQGHAVTVRCGLHIRAMLQVCISFNLFIYLFHRSTLANSAIGYRTCQEPNDSQHYNTELSHIRYKSHIKNDHTNKNSGFSKTRI
jgi:hypothetical protein